MYIEVRVQGLLMVLARQNMPNANKSYYTASHSLTRSATLHFEKQHANHLLWPLWGSRGPSEPRAANERHKVCESALAGSINARLFTRDSMRLFDVVYLSATVQAGSSHTDDIAMLHFDRNGKQTIPSCICCKIPEALLGSQDPCN